MAEAMSTQAVLPVELATQIAVVQEGGLLKQRHLIGVMLAVFGNCLISIALNLQKHAHNGLLDGENYCLSKLWWLGMITMALGEVGNFLAYGFAPASVVAPLGCVGVLANAIIAFIFLKERLSPQSLMGVALIAAGSFILISFSTKDQPVLTVANIQSYLKNWVFITYIVMEAIMFCIVLYYIKFRDQETIITLLVAVALLASITVIAAKGVSSMLSESVLTGKQQILNPAFWVMLVSLPLTTIPQIRFLNRAMQLYDVSDVVPVNFMFFTLSAILAGTVFYQEFYGLPVTKILLFIFGCVVSFIGVFIIMRRDHSKDEKSKHSNSEQCGLDTNRPENGSQNGSDRSHSLLSTNEKDSLINKKKKVKRQSSHQMLNQFVSLVKQSESIEKIQPASVHD